MGITVLADRNIHVPGVVVRADARGDLGSTAAISQ